MENQVIAGSLRVQFLSEDIVRVEYAADKKFFDGQTLFIPSRREFAGFGGFTVRKESDGTEVLFSDWKLVLPADASGLGNVVLFRGAKRIRSLRGIKNTGELPPLGKTPEVFALADAPRIVLPEGGYSAWRKSEYVVQKNVQDVYLLLCQKDAKKLRRLYVQHTGRCEMPRLSTFGAWNSKYYKYDEQSAKQVISDYEKYDVPLDNMVIDTDWRAASDRGIGYDIDTALFPDMKRFFDFAHAHGVEIMFNDHPEPVDGADSVFSPAEIAFREEKLQHLLELGLDTWWYDRNWSTKLKSPVKGIKPETLGMYLFQDITKHFYQKQAGDDEKFRRPVIMANVVEVTNGCYIGIHDSASHRYSIQWTGDIDSDDFSIAQEVQTLIRASDNCIPYVNADCGGHIGNPDAELYLRWIAFGVMSPVFRPHCTNIVHRFREPWLYDEETLSVARAYIKMRYRLLPVFYAAAFNNYKTGEPICRGLGWEFPKDKNALGCCKEFMLGKDILVAPMFGETPVRLKKENYVSPVKATFYDGKTWAGEPLAQKDYKTMEMELDHNSPCHGVPVYNFCATFETDLIFEEESDLFLRIDDGATVYLDGKLVLEDDTLHSAMMFYLARVSAGETHHIVIRYFQAGGEASCVLFMRKSINLNVRDVYIPQGKWLDVFTGKVYHEKGCIKGGFSNGETSLFVRAGALIPLAHDAENTKKQKWDTLSFDYYPDRDAKDEGVLYEDDGETTAYMNGEYRTSAYRAFYDADQKAYVVEMDGAEGAFSGERACIERKVAVRLHSAFCKDSIARVTLNGEDLPFEMLKQEKNAFPFAAEGGARDGEILQVTFPSKTEKEYRLKFFIKEGV